mgnify:CR=1 FL=1
MATGSGKTFTAVNVAYRLLKFAGECPRARLHAQHGDPAGELEQGRAEGGAQERQAQLQQLVLVGIDVREHAQRFERRRGGQL